MIGVYEFYPEKVWALVSDEARQVISALLVTDASKRLSITGLRLHAWCSDAIALHNAGPAANAVAELQQANAAAENATVQEEAVREEAAVRKEAAVEEMAMREEAVQEEAAEGEAAAMPELEAVQSATALTPGMQPVPQPSGVTEGQVGRQPHGTWPTPPPPPPPLPPLPLPPVPAKRWSSSWDRYLREHQAKMERAMGIAVGHAMRSKPLQLKAHVAAVLARHDSGDASLAVGLMASGSEPDPEWDPDRALRYLEGVFEQAITACLQANAVDPVSFIAQQMASVEVR